MNRWRWPEPREISDEAIKTMQQMLRGFQMWRESWRKMTDWSTQRERRPINWGAVPGEIRQAGRSAVERLGQPFTEWWRQPPRG